MGNAGGGLREQRGSPGREVLTLRGSGAHQGDPPTPQTVPAQHGEAEAIGSGRHQAGQEERVP